MRQIKFRAWSERYEVMRNITDIRFGGMVGYDKPVDNCIGEELRNIKLMQFTGLLDKNGKEIYEGDVLFDEDGEYSKTCAIEWDTDNARFFGKSIFDSDSYNMEEIDGQIIGNIYENPELLK